MFFIKKLIIIIAITISFLCLNQNKKNIYIPDDAIRIRVIANSNKIEDQLLKLKVKTKLEQDIYSKLENTKDIKNARAILKKNITNINNIIYKTINSNDYNVNYGNNYFPEKELNGIKYTPGNYESLVITLGKGQGENWWCVLFPPLCAVDVKDNDKDNIEYKSKVLEILKDYR